MSSCQTVDYWLCVCHIEFIKTGFKILNFLQDVRLELDMKEEALSSLRREMEEMSFGVGTEEEIAQLKRAKLDAEKQCKEQEEELDDMAGQIQVQSPPLLPHN